MSRRRGISLIELLVVIAILGIMAAAVAPTLPTVRGAATDRASELVHVLRRARRRAIERQQPVSVIVDAAEGAAWVVARGDSAERAELGPLAGSVVPGASAIRARVEFRFDPSGAAAGNAVTLVENGVPVLVGVEAWSGTPYARRGSQASR